MVAIIQAYSSNPLHTETKSSWASWRTARRRRTTPDWNCRQISLVIDDLDRTLIWLSPSAVKSSRGLASQPAQNQ